MAMVPMGGVLGSSAGAPLSQTRGSEIERAQKDSLYQAREADGAKVAERASGIGETEQGQESSDRDADGRRLWERSPEGESQDATVDSDAPRQSKDATGESGGLLDLMG